jgi:hypothetical protein
MGLVSWDVRAVYENAYDTSLAQIRQAVQQGT